MSILKRYFCLFGYSTRLFPAFIISLFAQITDENIIRTIIYSQISDFQYGVGSDIWRFCEWDIYSSLPVCEPHANEEDVVFEVVKKSVGIYEKIEILNNE